MSIGETNQTRSAGDDLIKRLRKRAADEREIQKNNEAVATALKGQRLLFEQRTGGHNNFAVRLGLQHENCAKNDAALASDWEEAADRIAALEAHVARCEQIIHDQDVFIAGMTPTPEPAPDDPVAEAARELTDYVLQADLHNRLTPRVVDIAFYAWQQGRSGKNADDGGPCDWFCDTRPMVMQEIEKIRAALRAISEDSHE